MKYLAIDPGNEESAYVVIDGDRRPLEFGKVENNDLLRDVLAGRDQSLADRAAIEMVASYGMAVGATVFDTCVWIGRFTERSPVRLRRVYREAVKIHHCRTKKAKDANIVQALVDRFAPGQPNHGKGTKAVPGWFHGFRADIWQAYALAVYLADISESREAPAP